MGTGGRRGGGPIKGVEDPKKVGGGGMDGWGGGGIGGGGMWIQGGPIQPGGGNEMAPFGRRGGTGNGKGGIT